MFYFILPAAIAAVTSWVLTPFTAVIARRLGGSIRAAHGS